VVEFNHETAQKIFRGLVKHHLLIFVSYKSDDYEKVVKMATKVSESYRNKLMFVTVDTDEDDHRRVIEFLGLNDETFPTMRIIQMKEDIDKYTTIEGEHDPHDVTNEDNVRKFVQDYMDGKIPQHFLTETLPKDWDKTPTKYLTGKNFDEIVFDKTKNVLVEFYAPWCGHCKQLSPIWDKLAETLAEEKKDDFVVAKIDATLNELSHSRVRSFPTIRLYKKGENEQVEYNGESNLDTSSFLICRYLILCLHLFNFRNFGGH
jgi:protein disulfide-isomerase A1